MLLPRAFLATLIIFFSLAPSALAVERFFIGTLDHRAVVDVDKTITLYLDTGSNSLTHGQTVLNFNTTYLTPKTSGWYYTYQSYTSTAGTTTGFFWVPADPSLGFGNTTTPFIYNSTKIPFSVGFTNGLPINTTYIPIVQITFTPKAIGTTTITFTNTTTWWGAGNITTPTTPPSFDLTIFESTAAAVATPTPTTTVTPTPTTLTSADLTFVEIGTNQSVTVNSTTSTSNLQITEEDNTIPPPPANMEKRPSATPFVFKLLQQPPGQDARQQDGQVLAVQSLRELLIPGKSSADKTVVLVNLISLLTFIVMLGIVVWRLIMVQKSNKLKSRHLQEIIISEIATIQSKLGAADTEEGKDKLKEELSQALSKLERTSSTPKL